MGNLKLYILFLGFVLITTPLFSQGTQVTFGKNRIQYHNDFKEWLQYDSRNFTTYWYGKGRNIGQAAVLIAEQDFNEIQNILEHRINDKIQIIVFTDLTDLKQSNIGGEEVFNNTGGQTKIVDKKIFVYFNGDHNHLRKQIREGIAEVYLNSMLFGSNLQEIVQNAVMMNLPEWFKSGIVAFVGQKWNTDLDSELRDVILSGEYTSFEEFATVNPKLAGHSMWYYIFQNYGKATVTNLLYLTRINRSIESGFLYVLGSSFEQTSFSWFDFFKNRYEKEAQARDSIFNTGNLIEIKNKRNLPITEAKLSPDGRYLAYVLNEIGKYRVFIQDIETGDRTKIFKLGSRNPFQATDYNYPLLAWKPNGQELAIMFEKRDMLKLLIYNTQNKKKEVDEMPTIYHRIFKMDFIDNYNMVVSASVRGFSDIFIFKTKTRQSEPITRDFYDDLDASFVNIDGKKGVLFASNRPDTSLLPQRFDSIIPVGNFDLFYYDLQKKEDNLIRVTNTPLANERYPIAVDSTYFGFLSDEYGLFNRKMGYLDTVLSHYNQIIALEDGSEIVLHQDSSLTSLDSTLIDTIILEPVYKTKSFLHDNTNLSRSIVKQHTAPRVDKIIEQFHFNGRDQLILKNLYPETRASAQNTEFKQFQITYEKFTPKKKKEKEKKEEKEPEEEIPTSIVPEKDTLSLDTVIVPVEKQDTGKIDIDNYLFQSEFEDEAEAIILDIEEEEKEEAPINLKRIEEQLLNPVEDKTVEKFRPSRITPYRLRFRTDFFTTQLDNSFLFGGQESYFNDGQEFGIPPLGILLKINFKDLFEDHEIEGGVRFPTTFNGAEYFLVYRNKKKRLDKEFAFYRRTLRFTDENTNPARRHRELITLGSYSLKYPLDIFRSLRLTTILREDRRIQLGTDRNSLETPTQTSQRAGLRLEYVFDNTIDVAVNIKNGTRYKIYSEVQKRFDFTVADNVSFQFGEGFMGVVGFDARHYQRLDKHSIFAARIAGATSFGAENIIYYLGGVDNWLFSSFNNEIDLPTTDPDKIAFQALATNMRGFRQNIRNGSNYALANAELRVPVFKYFFKNIRSNFFRNFQVVGFFDVGTAWTGVDPFGEDNPLNTDEVRNSKITVNVNYFRDPVVYGYGAGIRSMLFGYFVRLDYAWGVETRVVQDPILYLSIGTDF